MIRLFFLLLILTLNPAAAETVDANYLLQALVSSADSEIENTAHALQILAVTSEARSGKWTAMKPLLAELEKTGVPAVLWYAAPDGSYSTVEQGKVAQNLKDRPYFPQLLKGERVVGYPVVSKSTGKMSAVVAVPVIVRGKVSGILGASIYLEELSARIKNTLGLGSDIVFFALDRERRTVLSWKSERIFQDPARQGSESLARATDLMLKNEEGTATYEFNGKKTVIFKKSRLTGWSFALGFERP